MTVMTQVLDEVDIHAPPAVVFAHLTAGDKLAQWWPQACESDPRPGGKLVLHWFGGGKLKTAYERCESATAIAFDFYTEHVAFALEAIAGGTRLRVCHSRIEVIDNDFSGLIHVAQSWASLLLTLKTLIERGLDLREG